MHPIVLLSKLSTDVVFRDFPGGKVVGFSLRRGDRATCSGFSWRGDAAPMFNAREFNRNSSKHSIVEYLSYNIIQFHRKSSF